MANFRLLRDIIMEALSTYDFELRKEDDKTAELVNTCAKLATRNAELEDKVKELTEVIAKLKVIQPGEKKSVIHG